MNKTDYCPVQGDIMEKNNEEIEALLICYKREEWK